MPWNASSVVEEKARFVFEREEQTMMELRQHCGIAHEIGHVLLRRYRGGLAGLGN